MSPLFAPVCPCYMLSHAKILSFSCSLDNCLLKSVIVFIFVIHILKWRPFGKGAIFYSFFTFFSHQWKDRKFLQHISYIKTQLPHPFDFSRLTKFVKKCQFIMYCFALVNLFVWILIRAISEQSMNNKMVSKIWVGMSTTYIYLN